MLLSCLFAFNATARESTVWSAIDTVFADTTQTTVQKPLDNDKVYRWGMQYLLGINADVDYTKALTAFDYLARQGDPRGFNSIAGMFRQGMGVQQDQAIARQQYFYASELGYGKASYNLAQMYKTAQGGEQDFRKAFEYMLKAEKQGDKAAIYMIGYMYCKGLGTKQNYKKAVEYFSKGTELGQTSSMYFLGLCYVEGYGVPKDIEKGKQLIEQAANLGNDHAAEFISKNLIGKYNKPKRVARAKGAGDASPAFRTKAGNTTLNLNGEWTGRILQYDWSKESITEEKNLNLKIVDENGKLSGIWLQSDTVSIELNAVQNGSVYETENMQYMLTWDRTYNIRSLEFTMETDEKGDSILYAVITQFSPQTVEPSRPTMLELRRSRSLSGAEVNTQTATDFRAYPIPFKDQLTVEFTAQQAGEYSILLYDLSGKLIRTDIVPVGDISVSGKRYAVSKTLNTAVLPVGTYSVNVKGKEVNVSTLVIKNKN